MKIEFYKIMFGADPELFISRDGQYIGAEKVLPKEGIQLINQETQQPDGRPVVIIDGVQAELNPRPNSCRESFSYELQHCFHRLDICLRENGAKAEFVQTIEVSEQEMKSLSPESQQFGCSPSNNAYGKSEISVKDASKYPYRSAGGHIHLGLDGYPELTKIRRKPEEIVKVLDIVLGNTCVLLDRDPGNKKRREVYGKAGEFRLPKYGLEYRTLSNFWLRSYPLMSLVLSLARFSVCIAANTKARNALFKVVDMKDITKAINENDAVLAQQNFDKIKELLHSMVYINAIGAQTMGYVTPFSGTMLANFELLVSQGIEHYFKEDPMSYWLRHRTGLGAEQFLTHVVKPTKEQAAAAKEAAAQQEEVPKKKSILATLVENVTF